VVVWGGGKMFRKFHSDRSNQNTVISEKLSIKNQIIGPRNGFLLSGSRKFKRKSHFKRAEF
jgi:hypothetical protein